MYHTHCGWIKKMFCIRLAFGAWKSSIKYTDDLERILPYFEHCYTLEEWNERLSCFSDAYDNAYDVFRRQRKRDRT